MSCANYKGLNYFDLCVNDCECELLDENEEPSGETEFDDCLYDNVVEELKKYNNNLKFFELNVECGYYSDIQIIPNAKGQYFNAEDFLEYYAEYSGIEIYADFRVNKYILKKQIEKEIKYINNVIFKELQNEYGFEILEIAGTFSNGETIYKKKGEIA